MIALPRHLFDDSDIPDPTAVLLRLPPVATTAVREAPAEPSALMPGSLWRHTEQESLVENREARSARRFLGILALVALGSVGYRAWQLAGLMSGNRLTEAVAAIAR